VLANSGLYYPASLVGLAVVRDAGQAVLDNLDASQAQVSQAQAAIIAKVATVRLKPSVPGASSVASLLPAAVAAASAPSGVSVAPVALSLAKPAIKGVAKVGRTLRVKVAASSASVSYQWYVGGKKVAKATKATYKVKAADRGKRIAVKATARKAGFTAVTKTSAKTAKVK
jgi:hypothetical protein